MTLKEYKKNYKIQKIQEKLEQNTKDKEKEVENMKKNILLYKILKNKKNSKGNVGNISYDISIKKTIENTFQNDENKKKVLNYLKKKKREDPKTSLTSPYRNHQLGVSPGFNTGNNKKNTNQDLFHDSFISNKNSNPMTTTHNKKIIKKYRAVTPLGKSNKRLNMSHEEKKLYGAAYKSKDRDVLFDNNNKTHDYNNTDLSGDKKIKNLKYIRKTPIKLNISNTNDKKNDNIIKEKNNKIKHNYMTTTNTARAKQHDKIILLKNKNNRKKNSSNLNNNSNSFDTSTLINKSKFDNL